MSVIDRFTDALGLTDSTKPLRQAEEQARRQLAEAEKARQRSAEAAAQTTAQTTLQQAQMQERARVQEQANAALAKSTGEADVKLALDEGENATRRRTKFQAPTDPLASIRI